ncbi:MAG: sigma-70 family RNA polymerase sigma factor [Moorea sp. SIO2B7]|nr:sigma-70 family RNA polymerase sigma factor [Moorena sp. SIO2B7]
MLADNQASTTDKQLVLRCQKRDHRSFPLLYQRYQQRVRSTLYQLCGAEVLDDLVQEVFLRVWKGLPKLRQASTFSTWLYRISWNVAMDQRRQFAKSPQQQKKPPEEEQNLSNSLSRPQDTPNLMQLHYQDLVQRGLQNLRIEHRVVLVLHDLEDIPQKEVAKILRIPVGTVKSRLFYARNTIKKFLQQHLAVSATAILGPCRGPPDRAPRSISTA